MRLAASLTKYLACGKGAAGGDVMVTGHRADPYRAVGQTVMPFSPATSRKLIKV